MKRPITDKAEVAVDFPEKFYHGTFDRDATFDVKADAHGVHIDLDRRVGERRHVGFHLHFYLLANIIESLATTLPKKGIMDDSQRSAIEDAVAKLDKSLKRKPGSKKKK
jgi:hypothetical protein